MPKSISFEGQLFEHGTLRTRARNAMICEWETSDQGPERHPIEKTNLEYHSQAICLLSARVKSWTIHAQID